MPGKNRLNVILGVDTTSLMKDLKRSGQMIEAFGRRVEYVGRDLTTLLTIPLAGVGAAALSAFAEVDRFERGLRAIASTSLDVTKEIQKLRTAAKEPGLSFRQAAQGSVALQAVGFSAEAARRTMIALGKAVAVTGGTADELKRVQIQIAQIAGKGTILEQDLRIIKEAAPGVAGALRDIFGVTTAEGIRSVTANSADFIKKLVEGIEQSKKYTGISDSLTNAWENLKDAIFVARSELGRSINEIFDVQGRIKALGEAVFDAVDAWNQLTTPVKRFILATGGIVAALGPVLFVGGKLIAVYGRIKVVIGEAIGFLVRFGFAIKAFLVTMSPWTAAIGLAAVLLAALYNESEPVRKVINGIGNAFLGVVRVLKEFGTSVALAFKSIFNFARGRPDKAFDDLTNAFDALKKSGAEFNDLFSFGGLAKGFQDGENKITKVITSIKGKVREFKESLFEDLKTDPDKVLSLEDFGDLGATGRGIKLKFLFEEEGFVPPTIPPVKFDTFGDEDFLKKIFQGRDAINELNKQLKAIDQEAKLFGEGGAEVTRKKLDAVRSTISKLIPELQSSSFSVEFLKSKFDAIEQSLARDMFSDLSRDLEQIANTAFNLGQGSAEAFRKEISLINQIAAQGISFPVDATKSQLETINKILRSGFSLPIDDVATQVETINKILAGGFEFPVEITSRQLKQIRSSLLETFENIPVDTLKDQIKEIQQVLESLTGTAAENTKEFKNWQAILGLLEERYEGLKSKQTFMQALVQAFGVELDAAKATAEAFGKGMLTFVDGITDSFDALVSGQKDAAKSIKQSGLQIIDILIKEGVTGIIRGVLAGKTGLLGLLAIPIAAAAGGLARGIFRKAVGLAKGGIVPPGYPNDQYPALLTSGETVLPKELPLDKLGTQGGFIAETRISGEDLVILLRRAENRFNRFT